MGEESCPPMVGAGGGAVSLLAGPWLLLTVRASEAVCPEYLLDAKTQVVDTVRFVSFAVGSSDFSHELGQTIVELGS